MVAPWAGSSAVLRASSNICHIDRSSGPRATPSRCVAVASMTTGREAAVAVPWHILNPAGLTLSRLKVTEGSLWQFLWLPLRPAAYAQRHGRPSGGSARRVCHCCRKYHFACTSTCMYTTGRTENLVGEPHTTPCGMHPGCLPVRTAVRARLVGERLGPSCHRFASPSRT